MKFKMFTNTLGKCLRVVCVGVLASLAVACSDDDENASATAPFDPSQPVTISYFTPESGGYQDQILIYGSNFGTNKEALELEIGGKKAVIVSCMSDKLYAYVPAGAFDGTVTLSVIDGEGNKHTATAPNKFQYNRKTVVGTLCGYKNANDDQGVTWGPFSTITGFNHEGTLAFDPVYPNRLYITYDFGEGYIAELDLDARVGKRLISASRFGTKRLRNIAFTKAVEGSKYLTKDGDYMLVSTDRDDNQFKSTSVWIVKRGGDGTFSDSNPTNILAAYKQCNGVAVHPVNGEVYFNSYSNGELFRLDLEKYFQLQDPTYMSEHPDATAWTGYKDDGCFKELFKIMDPSYEFTITIHPSGDYAYLTVINRNYILRTDYDWDKKEFTTPYIIAGSNGQKGWEDAVGSNSRVSRPYQGVFVKNQKYVEEGRDDVYDYYFADCTNFCVRYITPDGMVRTYAGHSPSTDGNIWGTEDGDLRQQARFRDVTGLVYDEAREKFYVLDHNNRRIRTIGEEDENTTTVIPDTPETPGEEGGEETPENPDNQE